MTKVQRSNTVLRYLPLGMRKFLMVPFFLVLIWLPLSMINLILADGEAPSSLVSSKDSKSIGEDSEHILKEISIKGSMPFKIKVKAKGVRVYIDGKTFKIKQGEDGELKFKDEGQTLGRLKVKDESLNLYDEANAIVYKVKIEAPEYKIKDVNGDLICRLKIKVDSFNIYDGQGKRIAKGKIKNGLLRIDDHGNQHYKIEGISDLNVAGFLALPLVPKYRALLWLHFDH